LLVLGGRNESGIDLGELLRDVLSSQLLTAFAPKQRRVRISRIMAAGAILPSIVKFSVADTTWETTLRAHSPLTSTPPVEPYR
jgi:hypothetical protein